MNFSLFQILCIGLAYLSTLFGIAYSVERGWLPSRLVRHPATYVLSLGVYVSAWAFYGSIELAHRFGYGFLAYYLGISGAFLLTPILLRPILRVTQAYQLTSLADLFAFRYRSRWAGAFVTLLMMVAILPLLALQIAAVSDAIHIVSKDTSQSTLAFGFCLLMILFAILYGARHVSPREKHAGLVFAIAFESLFKLIAFTIVGAFALFVIFDGPSDLDIWLGANAELLSQIHHPLTEGPWRTLLLLFFAAAIVMPHMFHMIFTENLHPEGLRKASWGVPLYLLLMAAWVPPILWAGIKLGYPTSPQYFTLGIGIASNSAWLSIIALTGGLAAGAGVIIVTTLSLAAMCLNHLILPLYQPSARWNIYSWLLWTKRILIALIILLSFAFYLKLSPVESLSNLGIVAFVAALHFLPGTMGVLYWPIANRKGFLAGLFVGMSMWFLTMLLPLLIYNNHTLHPLLSWVGMLGPENWHTAAISSLAGNIIAFILVSMFTKPGPGEQSAADACSIDTLSRPKRQELIPNSSQEFIDKLAKPLGYAVAEREVNQALNDLRLQNIEVRPYALRQLRSRIEANLSGLMGPSIAQQIVDRYLPFKQESHKNINEDIHAIESGLETYQTRLTGLAAELDSLRRFHRQTLQNLPIGVCSLGNDKELLMWNHAMEALTSIHSSDVVGSKSDTLEEPWSSLINDFINDQSEHLYKREIEVKGRRRWLNLHKSSIEHSESQQHEGIVLLLEDQTDTQMLEEELAHSERLASIGRLAAGVAHEIGNPVTAIACLAQNLQYETDPDEVQNTSKQVIEQTQRITRIVQSLMNFSHSGQKSDKVAQEPVSIHECASEAINLISLSHKSKQLSYLNLCDPALNVLGDSQRLLQVFVNLISNAQDASPDGGRITVQCTYTEHTVVTEITDEGTGIAKEKLDRVFEPFFTTKEPGQGTGLGLSLVYSIIEEHYGHIAIESPVSIDKQTGTKVIVTLPRFHDTVKSSSSQ